MGFTPADVDGMTLLEFAWCSHGYAKAHNPESDKGLSEDEIQYLSDKLDQHSTR